MNALLEVRDLHVHYGVSHVLQGVHLDVDHGQVVALFGRNGVGKTTLVNTVMGMIHPTSGSVRFEDKEVGGLPAHRVARHGLSLVPQGRRIFPTLSAEENLRVARRTAGPGGWDLDRVYELLPSLAARRNNRGNQLSGGEQQMVAIGRALLRNPRLVLLDEPSEGLAPRVVDDIAEVLTSLRDEDIPTLLVEQNLGLGVRLADTVSIMTKGTIAYRGTVDAFRREPETARALLGV